MKIKPLYSLLKVYQSVWYVVINLVSAIAYYFTIQYLVTSSNYGIVLFTIPIYLIYALVITASVLFTLSIYLIRQNIRRFSLKGGAARGIFSYISIIFGGVIAGCACQAPILYSVLYFVGFNAIEASSFVSEIVQYQIDITIVLVILNLIVIYFTLSRVWQAYDR